MIKQTGSTVTQGS